MVNTGALLGSGQILINCSVFLIVSVIDFTVFAAELVADGLAVSGGRVAPHVLDGLGLHPGEEQEHAEQEDQAGDKDADLAPALGSSCHVTVVPEDLGGLGRLGHEHIVLKKSLIDFFDSKQLSGLLNIQILFLLLFLLLSSKLRVTEVLHGTVLALLPLESNESSYGSNEISALLLAELVNLLVEGWDLLQVALGYEGASLGEQRQQFLVVEAKADVGNSDLVDVLDNVGQRAQLLGDVEFQESFKSDDGKSNTSMVRG